MSTFDRDNALHLLKALYVGEAVYRLDGGGDSGTVELEEVISADGSAGAFPAATVDFTDQGRTVQLRAALLDLLYDVPDFDWIKNEGGRGTVLLRPQEDDPGLRIECDMTWNGDEDGDPDFEDDDDGHKPDQAVPGGPIEIDDSTLHPESGEQP